MSGFYFSSLLQEFKYLFINAAADGTRGGCGQEKGLGGENQTRGPACK